MKSLFALAVMCLTPSWGHFSEPSRTTEPVSIHTDFEGGNLGKITQISETQWRCALAGESDSENRNRQASWYYFRIDGAENTLLTIDLTDLVGEYNYKSGVHALTSETRPVISYDQINWRHLTDQEVAWNEEKIELTLTFTPSQNKVWVAHLPPYTAQSLDSLLSSYANHPSVTVQSIGKTPEKRDMQQITLTNPKIALEEKKVVCLLVRQHSWESGTSWILEGVIRYVLDTEKGESFLNQIVFLIIPMGDPDGVARGGVRFNAFGHDLNRNWDYVIPEEMPEINAQKNAILTWKNQNQGKPIDLFLTLHNTESADYVQGPNLPVGEKLLTEMVENSSFDSETGLREMPKSTTLGKRGRMTVNQALWAEQKIPAYLMEFKVEKVEKLGHRRSIEDWLTLGQKLAEVLSSALY